VTELYRWPGEGKADLRDGVTPREVVEALYAPATLRLDNRVPAREPTFMAVCAPTEDQRLIVVVCTAHGESWIISGARDAGMKERQMWRKHTS
jgi:hypothetical protein